MTGGSSSESVTRLQRYATSSGAELDAHRRGLDRRATGVVARGVEAEDRHVADVAARRQTGRDHRGPADLGRAPRARPGAACARLRAACGRRARASGTSAQPSGTNTTYFIAAHHTVRAGAGSPAAGAATRSLRRCVPSGSRSCARARRVQQRLVARQRRRRLRRRRVPRPTDDRAVDHDDRTPSTRRRRPAARTRPRRRARRAHDPSSSGLDSPVALAWRAHDTRMFVAEQAGRVRVVDADGQLSPTPVLTVGPLSHGNEEGLLGITFSPDGSKLYVDYTDPASDTHVDEYTMQRRRRGRVDAPRRCCSSTQPFANHNGGEVIIGPDGMLYIGLGDGGSGGDPKHNGQNLGTLLAQDPAHRPDAERRRAVLGPGRQSVRRRRPARAPEIVDVGPAQPVALLVRSRDRRHVDRRRRPEQLRGDRLRARGREGHQLGLERARGLPRVPRWRPPAGARDPILETRTPTATARSSAATCTAARAIPALDGVYLFGDNCRPNLVGVVESGGQASSHNATSARPSPQLTTFGEDPDGELYAVHAQRHGVPVHAPGCTRAQWAARFSTAAPTRRVIACGVTAEKLPSTLLMCAGDHDRPVLGEAVETGARDLGRPPAT